MFQRKALAVAISAASVCGAVAVPVGAEEGVIEEVYVTGSRIGRDEFQYASPVSVYSAQDLREAGAVSLDEFLLKQPEFNGYALGTTTNNGNNGAKMVDLRGLGHKRTLVLVNGRRQVGGFVGSSLDLGAVDLNTIPMAMVERVEVLKDGASTTYGSDAIAGVVNVILKDRFEGVEFSAGTGRGTENWDADTESLAMTVGVVSDKGGVTFGIEYQNQDELAQSERKWGEFATWPFINENGVFVNENLGSSNSRTITFDGDTQEAVFDQIAEEAGESLTRFTVDAATGEVRPYNGATDSYNYASVNALITPNERWQMTAVGDSEIASTSLSTVNAHGEIMYTKRKSLQRLAPDASFDVLTYNGLPNNWVPASNPYNPFGDNADNPYGVEGEGVILRRRFVESGGRLFSQNSDTYRFVAGLDGELSNGINWDISYVFADNQETYETNFYGRFDRWATIVDPNLCEADPACAAAAGDDGFNPFGAYGSITPDEMTYLSAGSLKDVYETHMTNLMLTVSGEFGALPGGSVGWAAGLERRSERARIIPDEFSSGGLTTSGALDPLRGAYTVEEVYAEFLLPIVADAPFAKSIDVEASVRYSDYNTSADDTTNYRVGVDWAVNDQIRARLVASTGFRAPNMVEYFTQAVTFPQSENYCEFTDIRTDLSDVGRANCAALGYPGDYEQGGEWQATYSQTAAAFDALGPEESDTITAGVVWEPAFAEDLQFSIDYYSIEIDDYIGLPDFNFLAKTCLESEGFSAPACDAFPSGTGILPWATDGVADDASTTLGNLGKVETAGIDLGANYTMGVSWGPISMLTFGLDASYMDKFDVTFPLTGDYELKGTAGNVGVGVYPEWRYNTSVGAGSDVWNVTWKMRWIDEVDDLYRPAEITNDAVGEDVFYHDLVASYTYENISVILGVDNVLDEEPPTYHSGFTMDTSPGFYDTLGRKAWMGVTVSL